MQSIDELLELSASTLEKSDDSVSMAMEEVSFCLSLWCMLPSFCKYNSCIFHKICNPEYNDKVFFHLFCLNSPLNNVQTRNPFPFKNRRSSYVEPKGFPYTSPFLLFTSLLPWISILPREFVIYGIGRLKLSHICPLAAWIIISLLFFVLPFMQRSDGARLHKENLTGSLKREHNRVSLEREILQSLFDLPERSEEAPKKTRLVRQARSVFGKPAVTPHKDTAKEHNPSAAKPLADTRGGSHCIFYAVHSFQRVVNATDYFHSRWK